MVVVVVVVLVVVFQGSVKNVKAMENLAYLPLIVVMGPIQSDVRAAGA